MEIAVVGMWHLGISYVAGLLEIGNKVKGFDSNLRTIANLQNDILPIEEPRISDVFRNHKLKGNLTFTYDKKHLAEVDIVWVCTDIQKNADETSNLQEIVDMITEIAFLVRENTTILISSQIPLGTTRSIIHKIEQQSPLKTLNLVYSPENLQLGNSLDTFLNATRHVFGIESEISKSRISKIMSEFKNEIVFTSIESAELLKHSLNCFLAMSIAFSNEIAYLADKYQANAFEVASMMRSDPRVGKKAYLNPGPNFGGETLVRDLNYIEYLTDNSNNYILKSIKQSNDQHFENILNLVKVEVQKGLNLGFAGITYKEDTSTLKGSQAIELAKALTNFENLYFFDNMAEDLHLKNLVKLDSYEELILMCDLIIMFRPNSEFIEVMSVMQIDNKKTILNYQGVFLDPAHFPQFNIINFGSINDN